MAEMLERQPSEVQSMLLRTSLVDRTKGELADLLTGRGHEVVGQAQNGVEAVVKARTLRPELVLACVLARRRVARDHRQPQPEGVGRPQRPQGVVAARHRRVLAPAPRPGYSGSRRIPQVVVGRVNHLGGTSTRRSVVLAGKPVPRPGQRQIHASGEAPGPDRRARQCSGTGRSPGVGRDERLVPARPVGGARFVIRHGPSNRRGGRARASGDLRPFGHGGRRC